MKMTSIIIRLSSGMVLPAIITATFFFLSGCSLIGSSIGSDMAPKTYQRYEIGRYILSSTLALRGKTVIISLNDGTAFRGTFTRLTYNSEDGPRFLILRQADTDVLIALDDIRRIHKPGKKNAKLVGLLIGASLDVAAFLLWRRLVNLLIAQ